MRPWLFQSLTPARRAQPVPLPLWWRLIVLGLLAVAVVTVVIAASVQS